jgi:hypothetical protein
MARSIVTCCNYLFEPVRTYSVQGKKYKYNSDRKQIERGHTMHCFDSSLVLTNKLLQGSDWNEGRPKFTPSKEPYTNIDDTYHLGAPQYPSTQ